MPISRLARLAPQKRPENNDYARQFRVAWRNGVTEDTPDTPRYIDFSLHYHLAFLVLPAAFLSTVSVAAIHTPHRRK
jgi:hypothetical protein